MQMTLKENLGPEWFEVLGPQFKLPYMQEIATKMIACGDYLRPVKEDVFNALRRCQPSQTKVVIIGQDPYPNNEAHGLSFSSKQPSIPPSLRVIFRELEQSGLGTRTNPNLTDWADQGVLMLNSILTTTYRIAGAHKDWGWQQFTKHATRHLLSTHRPINAEPIIVMLWGAYAQNLVDFPIGSNVHVLKACHPQAENYNPSKNRFTGCDHFSSANILLQSYGLTPIKWVQDA